MNGITVKETRREEDKRFFRMIAGVEEPEVIIPENDVMLADEPKEDHESETDDAEEDTQGADVE